MATRKAPATRTPAQKAAMTRRSDRMIQFIEKYVYVPEGMLVGKPMVLLPEQKDFIRAVYDNVSADGLLITRRGFLSIARKNGKTGLIAALLEGHTIGPEAKPNSNVYSAARSRDQAALVFNYAVKSIRMNPKLEGLVQITDSGKRLVGMTQNVTYRALSADATTAHGLSPALNVHDELGQVVGPVDNLYDALESAGGAQEEPLSLIISTQAASDGDLLSILLDDAIRNPSPENVVRLYAADKDADIYDPAIWYKTNFALGKFRSLKEFTEAAQRAKRLPSFEPKFRNLYLNMRVALNSLFITPSLWKQNGTEPVDHSLFTSGLPVHIGLDLSQRTDLTSAVLSVQNPDDGTVHLITYVYTPSIGIEERAMTDRAPYVVWVDQDFIIAVGGRVVDYEQVAFHLAEATEGMNIASISFDRWRIDLFKKEAALAGLAPASEEDGWVPVGQGFKDMSPRLESVETLLLNNKIRHGNNPVLTYAAGNAIAIMDPARNRKLEKAKSSGRIDPLVAMVMAVHATVAPADEGDEVGEDDFCIA